MIPPYRSAMHVLAEETLPLTNVHSGNLIADRQVVPATQTPFTPYVGTTIVALDLLAGFLVASTESVGKSGNVLPATMLSYLVANRPTCR